MHAVKQCQHHAHGKTSHAWQETLRNTAAHCLGTFENIAAKHTNKLA
jgi:hypothetical protein